MLRLYCSNRTESLAKVVAAIMRAQPLKQAFDREQVIIQSQGMGTWLNQFLSKELGIVAGLETHMPASFVWRVARECLETKRANPQFDKAILRWEIYQRLPELLDQAAFAPLKRYLNDLSKSESSDSTFVETNHALSQTDLYELSTQLADSLDAYQNYRHEWLQAWDQGESIVGASHPALAELERWQAELWRRLYPQLPASQRLHRPAQLEALAQALQSLPEQPLPEQALPERLFVFGLSSFPPQWIELLVHLGKIMDVHFLIQNPCRYYWGDVQTEQQQLRLQKSLIDKGVSVETAADLFIESNPLLASWGRLGRDYISTLLELENDLGTGQAELVEIYDDWIEAGNDELSDTSAEASALKILQQDILDLNSGVREVAVEDASIRFASCHSRLRELEALKDYLLEALDNDPTLECSDIIVMMPDVQDYAPLIPAVFSEAVENEQGFSQSLSYAVSDQSVRHHQPLLEAFIELLQLSQSRVTSAEVMAWLELEAIRARFGFAEEDLSQLQQWVSALNIRWGLSSHHKQTALNGDRPVDSANTWQRARQRLLAGLVYGGGQVLSSDSERFQAFEVSSTEQQALLARLIDCLDVLEWSIAQMREPRQGSEWIAFVVALKNEWIDPDVAPEQFESNVMRAIEDLEKQFATAEFEQAIPFSVIAKALTTQLEQERVSQRFLAGSINFCTLMPMRSIPFKVVCLLGLNDGEYPRTVHGNSFDLLAMTPAKKGDRSRREDDRYLFLEALLSVRERLYISYIGHDPQDNSERFPSVLVSELRECIASNFRFVESESERTPLDVWTREHRLQPFHPSYYRHQADGHSDEALSYDKRWAALYSEHAILEHKQALEPTAGFEQSATGPLEAVSVDLEELSLSELMRAFRHPAKYYYQTVLGLSAPNLVEPLEEDEPFAADGLALYQLKEQLLAARLQFILDADDAGEDDAEEAWAIELERLHESWRITESLPAAPLDQYEMSQATIASQEMSAQIAGLGELQWLNIELLIEMSDTEAGQDSKLSAETPVTGKTCRVRAQFAYDRQGQVVLSASAHLAKRFWSDWAGHVLWNVASPGQATRILTPDSEFWLPALSEQEAKHYAGELIAFYQQCARAPVCLLPQSAFVSVFDEGALPKLFWGTGAGANAQAGEAADYYFARAQSASAQLSEHERWLRDEGRGVEYVLPSFDHLAIVQQVITHQDHIGERAEPEGAA